MTIVSLSSEEIEGIFDAQVLQLLLQREGLASLLLAKLKSLGIQEVRIGKGVTETLIDSEVKEATELPIQASPVQNVQPSPE